MTQKDEEKKVTKPAVPAKPNSFMRRMGTRITFQTPILGGSSPYADVARKHVQDKAPDAKTLEEEVAATSVDQVLKDSMTVFPKINGRPINWAYQWKGFFKSVCSALARIPGTESSKLVAYRKVIAMNVFPEPNVIPLILPTPLQDCVFPVNYEEGATVGTLERPLRAETAQGPRIALANSEVLCPGTTAEFTILYPDLKAKGVNLEKCIREWMNYGSLHGHGQWRNGGFGRFTWEEITIDQ